VTVKSCPYCGMKNDESRTTCDRCGLRLGSSVATPVQPAVAAPARVEPDVALAETLMSMPAVSAQAIAEARAAQAQAPAPAPAAAPAPAPAPAPASASASAPTPTPTPAPASAARPRRTSGTSKSLIILFVALGVLVAAGITALIATRGHDRRPRSSSQPEKAPPMDVRPTSPIKSTGIPGCDELVLLVACGQQRVPAAERAKVDRLAADLAKNLESLDALRQLQPERLPQMEKTCVESAQQLRQLFAQKKELAGCVEGKSP
jgi:hypothetical protein